MQHDIRHAFLQIDRDASLEWPLVLAAALTEAGHTCSQTRVPTKKLTDVIDNVIRASFPHSDHDPHCFMQTCS